MYHYRVRSLLEDRTCYSIGGASQWPFTHSGPPTLAPRCWTLLSPCTRAFTLPTLGYQPFPSSGPPSLFTHRLPALLLLTLAVCTYSHWATCPVITHTGPPALLLLTLAVCPVITHTGRLHYYYSHWAACPVSTHTGRLPCLLTLGHLPYPL